MMITPNNIPQGYKATPLGIIPQEWEVRRFRDVGHFLRNNTLSRDKMSESDGCVQNIHYGDVLIKYREILNVSRTNIPWIVGNSKDSPLGDMLQDGDIIISDTAEDYTVGKATELLEINGASVVAGLHTMPFRPLSNLFSPCFLGYYLNSMAYRFQLYALIQGIKVCAISKKAMSGTFLIVPPLAEQKKIAEVLGVWDKAIEKQSQLIEQLTLRKRGLMQQLLTAKRRLPGFSDPWKVCELRELFKERNENNRVDLPLLSISGDKGVILQTESDKRDISNDDKSKYKRINKGDIGYNTMRMWQGRSALSNIEGIVSPAYTIVIPNEGVDGYYMSVLFKQPRLMYDFWTHSQGLVEDTLNCKYRDFGRVRISCPSYIEQKAIAQVLTAADREIELAQQKLELLRQQKRGLMQQLLTGKKRVKY